MPGGSLTSKPTWSDTFGCSATSAFLLAFGGAPAVATTRFFSARALLVCSTALSLYETALADCSLSGP